MEVVDLNDVQEPEPNCADCIHTKPCGIKATMLQAAAMTAGMNPNVEETGAAFANTYAKVCNCPHYLIGDSGQ